MTQWHEQSSDSLTAQINAAGSNQSLNTTDSPTFAGLTVIGKAFLRQATVTLTDQQIRELPTTAQALVAAPGANKVILPRTFVLAHDSWAAGYGNHGDEFMKLDFSGSGQMAFVDDAATESFFNTGDSRFIFFPSLTGTFGTTAPAEGQPIDLALLPFAGGWSDWANRALLLSVGNSLGDFTDGHANNTMRVSVAYFVLNLSTGLFE